MTAHGSGGAPEGRPNDFGIEWNAENQLKRVTKDAVEVARFGYDPLGRRVEKVAGGATVSFTHDLEDLIREVGLAGVSLKHIHGIGIDEPLASED